ncbi:MAG: toxin-antitoxin system VapC family toxin component [Phormidesmis priestleyi Ana]|uniref:Toxin-antitoxin system VapC family toxin component n=1 Tax=Phormidesmis priestleyi Ana TaxID=1666911 RepID=A0A0P7ZZQ0_9CYAN|nr:MAG: toxin-antitoxin system VapC family toxin component [Phormidesmis priestleyi Ana]
MSGKRYLLDTNAIIALLANNSQVFEVTQQADWIGISVIGQLEFLAFDALSPSDQILFERFKQRVDVINLSSDQTELLSGIIEIRQNYRLKLPDAIIAATAIHTLSTLVTADKEFQKIKELSIYWF